MKRFSLGKLGLTVLMASGLQASLQAFTYTDADLLLVFRSDTFNDVEFNLGSVSNYLRLPMGTIITVTNASSGLVRSNFNNSLTGVSAAVLGATAPDDALRRVWLTDSGAGLPQDITGSKFGNIRSKVSYVGLQAQTSSGASAVGNFVASSSSEASYSYIASSAGSQPTSTLGGTSSFTVESTVAGRVPFFELKVSTVLQKPDAQQVGVFSFADDGTVTYQSGPDSLTLPIAPKIQITRNGTKSTITFATQSGVTYRLHASNTLGSPVSQWPVVGNPITGDSTTGSLSEDAAGSLRFYAVEATR